MILGVDHVALSTGDVRAGARALEESGLRRRFLEEGLPNARAKAAFLGSYAPEHSIALFDAPSGPSVELVQHSRSLPPRSAPYQVLLGGAPPSLGPAEPARADLARVWSRALGREAPERAPWPAFGSSVWRWPGSPSAASVAALLVPCPSFEASERFWTDGLGFTRSGAGTEGGRRWARLGRGAPVPAWRLEAVLSEAEPGPEPARLDDRGFPCLAFLASALESDLERLLACGGSEASVPFEHRVNGRSMRVALLRGPSGELIELIEVARGKGGAHA